MADAGLIQALGQGQVTVSGVVRHGRVAALTGGEVEIGSAGTIDHGMVIATSGTVQIDAGGTLADALLSGDGTFQTGNAASNGWYGYYGSILQNITLGTETTFTAASSGAMVLREIIDNSGSLAVAVNGRLVIDGGVTLAGGGNLVLSDPS